MAVYFFKRLLLLLNFYLSAYFLPFSIEPNSKIKSVSLGGWLVFEGAVKPLAYEGIPNKDLLDGTRLQFKAVKMGRWLKSMEGGGDVVLACSWLPYNYETFRIWRFNETTFQIRTDKKWFWNLDEQNNLVAFSTKSGTAGMFQIERDPNRLNRIRLKAPNGRYIQVTSDVENGVTADYEGKTDWSDNDPSVFEITIDVALHGEYQLTNGYGPEKAPQIMKEHWETFITEEDFKFVAENGLNAVRIPIAWWIVLDPPPKPYVGGSLEYLDKAFTWANKYALKVIINLHGARCSQNGYDHTSTIDGFPEWGASEQNIQETIDVIDFIAARYSKYPNLFAIALMNEPLAPEVTFEALTKYYKGAYEAIRKYSSTIYVMMESRIGDADALEIFPLASSLKRTVIDLHLYNLFDSAYDNMTVQENIALVYGAQADKLAIVTKTNGPLTFVGEWSDEWEVKNATKEDYQRYAKAQLEVYGRATLGWAYWSLKHDLNHWNFEWMVKNGYIKL